MVGIMHEWVLDTSAYDLATAAPALIDMLLAGLKGGSAPAATRASDVRAGRGRLTVFARNCMGRAAPVLLRRGTAS